MSVYTVTWSKKNAYTRTHMPPQVMRFYTYNIIMTGLVGAMVFSFMLAIVYEGLKTVRDVLASATHKWLKPSRHRSLNATEKSPLLGKDEYTALTLTLICPSRK